MNLRKDTDQVLSTLDARLAAYERGRKSYSGVQAVEGKHTGTGKAVTGEVKAAENRLLDQIGVAKDQVKKVNTELEALDAQRNRIDRTRETLNDGTRVDDVYRKLETLIEVTHQQRDSLLEGMHKAADALRGPRGNAWTGGLPPQPPPVAARATPSPEASDEELEDMLGLGPV